MATNDDELIAEARLLTDYDSSILSDSDFKGLVDLCKEELRDDLGDPDNLTWYSSDWLSATRALFWFVCISAKIKAGEIAGINIEVTDIVTQNPAQSHYQPWFRNFRKKRAKAQKSTNPGAASRVLERDNRTYGE